MNAEIHYRPDYRDVEQLDAMRALFIFYGRNANLSDLHSRYPAAAAALRDVYMRLHELKKTRCERIGERLSRDYADPLTNERERAYEIAHVRLELALDELMTEVGALHAAMEAVKRMLSHQQSDCLIATGTETTIARNNVICAADLIDRACALCSEITQNEFESAPIGQGIERTFRALKDEREWVTITSVGGGSCKWTSKEPPPPPYGTFEEARAEAVRWINDPEIDRGHAEVYNVRTREVILVKP